MPLVNDDVLPHMLEPGDEILDREDDTPTNVFVETVWVDPEGTWVDTSDGECGYVMERRRWRIARVCDE